MRIAFIGTRGVPASYSGFETCVEQVGRRMVERGNEVTVFCRAGHYSNRPRSYLGMKLVYLPAIKQKHLETLSHTAMSLLRLPKDTAIVCMGVGNAPLVRWLELAGRRVVFNVDGTDWQRDKWGRFARWYLRTCEGLAARGNSIVIADAKAVQDYYVSAHGRQTELVPYGAEAPTDTGAGTLNRFHLEPDGYVLFVGRLVPDNAPGDFLIGVGLAKLDAPAVVVGDAPYAEEYKRRLRGFAPPGTVFTGYQFGAAYQQLTAHARVFVLAATVGGTHPVLVEQMAAGKLILARDTASNREVLAGTGLYWDKPEQLGALLTAIWNDPARRKQLGDAARARALELYSWDRVTSRYLDLCEQTMARRAPSVDRPSPAKDQETTR